MRTRRHHNNYGKVTIRSGRLQNDASYFERKYADPDWHEYERQKRELVAANLTPAEYEAEIQRIAKRMRI